MVRSNFEGRDEGAGGRRNGFKAPTGFEYLISADSETILERLIDPNELEVLGLYDKVEALLRDQAVIVSPRRLLERWIAELAARRYGCNEPFDQWLDEAGTRALALVHSSMEMDEQNQLPIHLCSEADWYRDFSTSVGLPLKSARQFCLALLSLPLLTRRAFMAVTIDRRSIPAACDELHLTENELGNHVRSAFSAIQAFTSGKPYDKHTPRDED